MKLSPFARLFAAKTRADADEEDVIDRKKDDAENEVADPDDAEELKDDDSDDADAKAKKAKAKKAKAKDDDPDVNDDAEAKAKAKAKAKEKDGDDDSDDEDEKDPKMRAARSRERGRIASILSSAAGQANPPAALFMALRTTTSRATAITDLAAVGPAEAEPPKPRHTASARARLAGVDVPDVGSNDTTAPSGSRATAEAIILAGRRARGEA